MKVFEDIFLNVGVFFGGEGEVDDCFVNFYVVD